MSDSCNVLMLVIMAAQSRNILHAGGGKKTVKINPVLKRLKLCHLVIALMSYQLSPTFWVFERASSSSYFYLMQSKGSLCV
jgi:hypothetical protein